MLLGDMWKDGKGGFILSLAFTGFICASTSYGLSFKPAISFFSWAMPLIYFAAARFRNLRKTANRVLDRQLSRVALVYLNHFGVDGDCFALKSAAVQSLIVCYSRDMESY